jgi:hypothetical protein
MCKALYVRLFTESVDTEGMTDVEPLVNMTQRPSGEKMKGEPKMNTAD